jgi:hypothetical protein
LLLALATRLLTAPTAFSQNTWTSRKNIFGGQDYRGRPPNIIGGNN